MVLSSLKVVAKKIWGGCLPLPAQPPQCDFKAVIEDFSTKEKIGKPTRL
jgi:hypothetical protein